MSDRPKMKIQAQGNCDVCGMVHVMVVQFTGFSVSVCYQCLEKAMYLLLDDA